MRSFLIGGMLAVMATVSAAGPAIADGASTVYKYDGSFDDAAFSVESAIIDKGLNIDYTSHVGEMLNRTGQDVGSDITLFDNAEIYIFCSAVLSRKMMEADPMNIAHCPYGIFVAERAGEVMVGYRNYPKGPMQEVQSLLEEIVIEALAE
ncbi:DUF302 domain-containing protein [Parasedimentitalea psychrophila]|uniref:DUF302 domain-containing protein n=1 Tax=Parasedimentitalea psychrophila TaxID=2997337 RepID=A0A9Y2P0L7_9RHOB|nr:DUF302 domain-containing protein [Parasedimentitalea psychrophila]WIY24721.1 DUF302 domain-containing protein [Parasedimentitalea psychrophila]